MALYETCIERVLRKDVITSKYFLGAFAINELPQKLKKFPCCMIINTHPRSKPGEHWLALFFNKKGFGYFFDSYGHSPDYYNLENYVQKISKIGWLYNKQRIQGFSDFCGYYCILFLLFISRDKENLFFKQFSKNYNKNDVELLNLLLKSISNY